MTYEKESEITEYTESVIKALALKDKFSMVQALNAPIDYRAREVDMLLNILEVVVQYAPTEVGCVLCKEIVQFVHAKSEERLDSVLKDIPCNPS